MEVPFDELRPSMDAALKRLSSQVRIPGFRPGKAPARIVEQRVGRAALLEDAVNEAIPRAYAEAVRESSVKTDRPAGRRGDQAGGRRLAGVHRRGRRAIPDIELPEYRKRCRSQSRRPRSPTSRSPSSWMRCGERFATLNGVERPVVDR